MAEEQPKSWWQNIPGMLTGIAGIIAVTGSIGVLDPEVVFGNNGNPGSKINSTDHIIVYYGGISVRCGADTDGDPQSCNTPYEVPFNNPYNKGILEIEYEVPDSHCGPIQVTLDLDGRNIGQSTFLGWNANPNYGPLSKKFYRSNVNKGSHTLELFGNGYQAGCNKGELNSFGGNLKVTLRPE